MIHSRCSGPQIQWPVSWFGGHMIFFVLPTWYLLTSGRQLCSLWRCISFCKSFEKRVLNQIAWVALLKEGCSPTQRVRWRNGCLQEKQQVSVSHPTTKLRWKHHLVMMGVSARQGKWISAWITQYLAHSCWWCCKHILESWTWHCLIPPHQHDLVCSGSWHCYWK